jgi:hypothetical protein
LFSFFGPGTTVGSGLDLADFLMGNPDNYFLTNPNSSNSVSVGNYWFNRANFSNARLTNLDTAGLTTSFYPYGTFPRNGLRGEGQTGSLQFQALHNPGTPRSGVGAATRSISSFLRSFRIHAQFQSPNTTITSSTFGQISTTYDSRILQLAIHLRF